MPMISLRRARANACVAAKVAQSDLNKEKFLGGVSWLALRS
jgi:hypothetical protein